MESNLKITPEETLHPYHENEVLQAIYNRRAVRKYKDVPVHLQFVEVILNAGRMAPSAINRQPWKFYVISNPGLIRECSEKIKKAAGKAMLRTGIKQLAKTAIEALHFPKSVGFMTSDDPIFHGAPLVILITGPRDDEWAAVDIGLCSENMMLAAHAIGIASCPVGFARYVEDTGIREKLGISEEEEVVLALVFGYADEIPQAHGRQSDNAVFFH